MSRATTHLARSFFKSRPAHAANLSPFVCRHRLHRKPRVLHQHRICQSFVEFDGVERNRFWHGRDRFDVHALPSSRFGCQIGMGEGNDFADAGDLLANVRMIEKSEVAHLHRPHVVARLIVTHARPRLARSSPLACSMPQEKTSGSDLRSQNWGLQQSASFSA